MTARSGRRCTALLRNVGPAGWLVKTLLESSTWHSMACLLRWKPKVTNHGRLYFQLAASARSTSDSESLLLPTPTTLAMMARANLWPTPTVHGNNNRKGMSANSGDGLATAVKMWRTPTNRKATDPQVGLADQVGGQLNPQWVEWLMGFPEGWTDSERSETQ